MGAVRHGDYIAKVRIAPVPAFADRVVVESPGASLRRGPDSAESCQRSASSGFGSCVSSRVDSTGYIDAEGRRLNADRAPAADVYKADRCSMAAGSW